MSGRRRAFTRELPAIRNRPSAGANGRGSPMTHSTFLRTALRRGRARWPLMATLSLLALAAGPLVLSTAPPVQAAEQATDLATGQAAEQAALDDGHDHAAEDLAGTSIDQIERQTAANADRIFRRTGRRPGVAAPDASVRAASADPGVSGSWSAVIGTDVVPVFSALLPSGKVLMWDSVGDNAAESYPNHNFTRAMVWNPVDNTYKRVDVQGYNIFCAGFTHLQNGDVLVAGGNKDSSLAGIVQTHIFNWRTETWSRGPDMAAGRWYPSVAETANGEATIVGGGPAVDEVYQTDGSIRSLANISDGTYGGRLYPFMNSRPDTQLALYGPYDLLKTLVTSGNGAVTGSRTRDGIGRDYGSFATFDVGRTLVSGGGNLNEDGLTHVPTRTSVIVDTRTGSVPSVTSTGSLNTRRRQFTSTILADGSVLATGGETSAAVSSLVDLDHAAQAAERWDPATGAWTTLASASRVRQYHSTATLLPDGRVLTGGGGVCGICMTVGYLEKNVEYFTPPYLYAKDGSGTLAPRPVISSAPTTIGIGTRFTITSDRAASIKKVGLVGLSSVTHDVDQGQRYVPLAFTVSGTTLTVTGPPSGGAAPPGYYMLFITDSSGVPSVATMIQVAKGPAPLMSAVKNTAAARCIDVPQSSLTSRTYLQIYSCNNTKAQALTRFLTGSSLRVLGNCVDVPSSQFVAGQRIWTFSCNNTKAQIWTFGSDGTIRPTAATTLCLAASATTKGAQVLLARCNGSSIQKWSW